MFSEKLCGCLVIGIRMRFAMGHVGPRGNIICSLSHKCVLSIMSCCEVRNPFETKTAVWQTDWICHIYVSLDGSPQYWHLVHTWHDSVKVSQDSLSNRFAIHVLKLCSITADFGLSKIIESEVQMQTVCGTPGYCGKSNQWSCLLFSKRLIDRKMK